MVVWLDAFWANAGLVRGEEYEACRRAGACTGMPELLQPREFEAWEHDLSRLARVAFSDAFAYCRWRGWRLPTADEFERMGRWTDGRSFVWGNRSCARCDRRTSPERIRELNGVAQWVAAPGGEGATMGLVDSVSLDAAWPGTMAAFRCVRSLQPGPNPGQGIVLRDAGGPDE